MPIIFFGRFPVDQYMFEWQKVVTKLLKDKDLQRRAKRSGLGHSSSLAEKGEFSRQRITLFKPCTVHSPRSSASQSPTRDRWRGGDGEKWSCSYSRVQMLCRKNPALLFVNSYRMMVWDQGVLPIEYVWSRFLCGDGADLLSMRRQQHWFGMGKLLMRLGSPKPRETWATAYTEAYNRSRRRQWQLKRWSLEQFPKEWEEQMQHVNRIGRQAFYVALGRTGRYLAAFEEIREIQENAESRVLTRKEEQRISELRQVSPPALFASRPSEVLKSIPSLTTKITKSLNA